MVTERAEPDQNHLWVGWFLVVYIFRLSDMFHSCTPNYKKFQNEKKKKSDFTWNQILLFGNEFAFCSFFLFRATIFSIRKTRLNY